MRRARFPMDALRIQPESHRPAATPTMALVCETEPARSKARIAATPASETS